ncbi:MAG: hypothetical protein AAB250_08090 [Bdellovibrionota bacterium]
MFLVLPGFLALAYSFAFARDFQEPLIYSVLAVGFIESGHVYTTFWRTYLHPDERNSSRIYVVVPLVIFGVFTIWMFFGRIGMWSFVAYANVFHHVRQYYGFNRWYQGLGAKPSRVSDFFLYALCLVPIVAYHFRSDAIKGYYSNDDLFLAPHPIAFAACVGLFGVVAFAWIVFEIRRWSAGAREPGRVLSILTPAAIYSICFFYGTTLTTILFPLVISHGVAYFGVMGESLRKTQSARFPTFVRAVTIVIGTAVVLGGSEFYFEQNWIDFTDVGPSGSGVASLVTGLYLVPLFSHFVFDAIIWRRKHRESRLMMVS